MNKIWLVAKQEYLHHVLRKRFLLILLGLPLFILLMGGMGIVVGLLSIDRTVIGVVDPAGYLDVEAAQYKIESEKNGIWDANSIVFIDDTAQAELRMAEEEISAYFVIPQEYPQAGAITLFASAEPSSETTSAIDDLLRQRLMRDVSPALQERIVDGPDMVVHSVESEKQQSSKEWYAILIPIFSGIMFVIVVNTSGGYLLRAVVEEKENRTMEIMLTSVSSNQLMAGKIFGNLSVGLTQLIIWFGLPILAYWILSPTLMKNFNIVIEPQFISLTLLTLIPAFILVAALMAALGATVTETQEAQQVSGLFTLPIVAPYWFMSLIMNNPNSAFSIGLSLFPLTAPVTLPLRAVFTDVPVWQSVIAISLLVICAAAAVRMAGSVFRLGMLRFGKRLSLKEVIRGLRKQEV
jgi:ABC-2 type transport system permease protein